MANHASEFHGGSGHPGHRAGTDFETVTETIAQIPLSKRTPLGWVFGFLIGFTLLSGLMVSLSWLLLKGIGIWGNNVPVAWAFDIINFVWWIGIGHAGTLISAILLLFKQQWRMSISRFAEAMTIFAVHVRGDLPDLPHRPSLAGGLLAVPLSRTRWACGRSSAARSSGTCSRSRPTPPSRSCSGTSA